MYSTPDQEERVFHRFPEDSRLLATLYSVVVRVSLCQRGSPLPVTPGVLVLVRFFFEKRDRR